MRLKGWVRTSLIDYPDHIATVLFAGGCNFRCPACHSADLVLCPDALPDLSAEEVWAFLVRRAGLVDGIVVTGGEPSIQPDLPAFLQQVRERGFDVKLDTNGYRPDVLAVLLESGVAGWLTFFISPSSTMPSTIGGNAA